MIYMGIDPGATGAVAAIENNALTCYIRDSLDGRAKLIKEIAGTGKEIVCLLEEPFVMPVKGRNSIASQYRDLGEWRGILTANNINFRMVEPKVWQRFMLLNKPRSAGLNRQQRRKVVKECAASAAARIWPQVDFRRTDRCTTPHEGAVDAALIADYCRRTWR